MITTIRRAVLASGVLAALGVASPALAATQRAHGGDLTASFTYTSTSRAPHHPTLTITKAGAVVYRHAVTAKLCGNRCAPASFDARHPSVRVVDLDGSATPQVVLNLDSGGAHCCTIVEVFSYDATHHHFVMSQRNFGDPGDELSDLSHDGRYEFVTADDRFAYAFTDYAASGLPIEIMAFQDGHFVDVTRNYPRLIRADAAGWRKIYQGMAAQGYADSVGVIAAWAADEDLLGRATQVSAYLSQQATAGHLNSALMPRESGQTFVYSLQMFLDHTGYSAQMCGGG